MDKYDIKTQQKLEEIETEIKELQAYTDLTEELIGKGKISKEEKKNVLEELQGNIEEIRKLIRLRDKTIKESHREYRKPIQKRNMKYRRNAMYREKRKLQELTKKNCGFKARTLDTHIRRVYYSNVSKPLKKVANRKVRYHKGHFKSKGSNYKKIYDYAWTLY